MKNTKRFFREMNKKLVQRNPLSKVYPFNKVNDNGPPRIQSFQEEDKEDLKRTPE